MNQNVNLLSDDKAIRAALRAAEDIVITTHVRPDGDAIGALLGCGLTLQAAGKQVQMVIDGGFPRKYKFLEGSTFIQDKTAQPIGFTIALDCADQNRAGEVFESRKIDLNIDHHITNPGFGLFNFIGVEYAATCAILADHLPKWGFEILPAAANALLMGIVTDTIGFRTPNVNPGLLRLSAELMEKGADLDLVYKNSLVSQSFSSVALWGAALNRIHQDGRIVWTSITLSDRKANNYNGWDDADLTNFLSTIEESDIAILFNQQKDDKVKVSWRSRGTIDVSKLAQSFHGGGHPPAAGAELDGSLQAVEEVVLKATKELLGEE
jgi:bifunctional oligoribonuclease and PAP phosphatase NrnA